jgi:hypothetical protein
VEERHDILQHSRETTAYVTKYCSLDSKQNITLKTFKEK